MPKNFSPGFLGLATLILGVSSLPLQAQAGFEWVAPTPTPNSAPAQSYGNNVYAPSAAANGPEVISPVVISGDTSPSFQAPVTITPSAPAANYNQQQYNSQPQQHYNPQPQNLSPQTQYNAQAQYNAQPPATLPITAPPPRMDTNLATATISSAPPPSGGDIVQGFATQVPLALALRQILPVGYNFSIDQSVSMDATVSYKGGRPWRDTVRDMVAPLGLTSHEQGSTISISRADMATASNAPLPPAPPMDSPVMIDRAPPMPPSSMMPSSSVRADVPAYNVNSPDGWSAEHGETLRKVLSEWCRRAGVELQWIAEYDYPVEASAHFSGSFEDAVRNLLAGFETARPQPVAELHMNPSAGQMVLVLQPRGNSYSN